MRVTCGDLEGFIECLKHEETLFQDTVRVDVAKRPIDGPGRNAIKYGVVFQASAVVHVGDESQYLLDMGMDCGTDYHDESQEFEGTQKAEELKRRLVEFCDTRGWRVLPGVITA